MVDEGVEADLQQLQLRDHQALEAVGHRLGREAAGHFGGSMAVADVGIIVLVRHVFAGLVKVVVEAQSRLRDPVHLKRAPPSHLRHRHRLNSAVKCQPLVSSARNTVEILWREALVQHVLRQLLDGLPQRGSSFHHAFRQSDVALKDGGNRRPDADKLLHCLEVGEADNGHLLLRGLVHLFSVQAHLVHCLDRVAGFLRGVLHFLGQIGSRLGDLRRGAGADLAPVSLEQDGAVVIAVAQRVLQWRAGPAVKHVWIGAGGEQVRHRQQLALGGGHVQRVAPVVVALIRLHTRLHQHCHHAHVAHGRRVA
mmetsp:Transcript_2549/g.6341  ORF Transcript_2549/g.6341 Transcript_2549/m.6341 type:complete len:309 (-) Transcript_2549:61-987(-)